MSAERFDDYDNLEHNVLKARHREWLTDALNLYLKNGGHVVRIERLTFDQLTMRWKSQKKTWNKNPKTGAVTEGVA